LLAKTLLYFNFYQHFSEISCGKCSFIEYLFENGLNRIFHLALERVTKGTKSGVWYKEQSVQYKLIGTAKCKYPLNLE
jgi:hypothetical protein